MDERGLPYKLGETMTEILITIFAVLISSVITGIIAVLLWNIGTLIAKKMEKKNENE